MAKCSKCGKEGVYYRLKTKDIVCNKCGHIEKVKEK